MGFTGTIGTETYTDAALFEVAARDAGYSFRREPSYKPKGYTSRRKAFKPRTGLDVGAEVEFVIDGQTVRGQVWSKAPRPSSVWIAGNDGVAYFADARGNVWTDALEGRMSALDAAQLRAPVGKVA